MDTILINKIVVNRDFRQRRELTDIDKLAESIAQIGLICPIVLRKDEDGILHLVAGERRLTAWSRLHKDKPIPYVLTSECSEEQLQLIELEENIQREDLPWKDHALAQLSIHELLAKVNSDWSLEKTAAYLRMSPQYFGMELTVAREILAGNPKILEAATMNAAYNIIRRQYQRRLANEMNEVYEVLTSREDLEEPSHDPSPEGLTEVDVGEMFTAPDVPKTPPKKTAAKAFVVTRGDFLTWSATYPGPRFNFIHCDFPYGVNHGASAQGGTKDGAWDGYADDPDVYWTLLRGLASNLERLALPSCHLMFWFSMKFYTETLDFFARETDFVINPIPLIWHKSDNKGIVSDVERSPRNVAEFCLMGSRGDRKIIEPVANVYAAPTNKATAIHVSEKPEPVLRHFFRMFVDEYTEMLDPTAGGGSALRAGYAAGAKLGFGLELNPDFAEAAELALTRRMAMDRLSNQLPKED